MTYRRISESQISLTQLMLPSHSNFSGKIHGGYILQIMDQVAFACASKHSGHYCVTASVNQVDFLNPIEVGELVHFKASVNYTGRTSMLVGLRVESEHIQTGVIKHCNSSYFTMVAKNEVGVNVPVPGLILDNEEAVRRFARNINRQKVAKERKEHFRAEEFILADYLEEVSKMNAKIEL
jgi:acyl-CoA hydrolase